MTSSSESFGMTGACLCGNIKLVLMQDIFSAPNGHICFCSNCRKYTGSIGLNALRTQKDKVRIEDPQGMIKTYRDFDTTSGKCVERHFCSNCSSPIFFTAEEDKVGFTIALGIFPGVPKPEWEFFRGERPEWQPSVAVKSFERSPTAKDVEEDA